MVDTLTKNAKLMQFDLGSRTTNWKTDFDAEILGPLDLLSGEKTNLTVTTTDYTMNEADTQTACLDVSGTLTGSRALIMGASQERYQLVINRCVPNVATNPYILQAKQGALATDIPYGPALVHYDGVTAPTVMPMPVAVITDVTIAATTLIGYTFGEQVRLASGTGPITSFGYAPAGTMKTVRIATAVTITYNATSMILPGAVSISAVSGDVGRFVSLGSSNWQCISWMKADGSILGPYATGAQIRTNTAGVGPIDPNGMWNAANEVIVTYTASWTPDMSTFINALMILTGNLTLNNPTNVKAGQAGVIRFAQDAGGSRAMTSWGTSWAFQNSVEPSLTAVPNSNDALFYYVVNSTFIICSFINAVG